MLYLYTLLFWIPTLASGIMLWITSGGGILNRRLPTLLWFLAALLFQVIGELFSPLWTIGLVCQTILAIYLAIRIALD